MFVHPEPYGDDHSLVLDCLPRTAPAKFKATSLFFPKNAGPAKAGSTGQERSRASVPPVSMPYRGKKMYLDSFAEPTMCGRYGSRPWI